MYYCMYISQDGLSYTAVTNIPKAQQLLQQVSWAFCITTLCNVGTAGGEGARKLTLIYHFPSDVTLSPCAIPLAFSKSQGHT